MSGGETKSERQRAAEADVEDFRIKLGPFVVAAETTRMPMVFTNAKAPNMPIIFVNQAFLAFAGYDEDEILGQNFNFLMEEGTDPEVLTEIRTAFEGGRDLETMVRYRRKSGDLCWVTVFINPVRDDSGDVVQHFASFMDITRYKEEEIRLRALSVQNTLGAVAMIAKQIFIGVADRNTVDSFIARIQELLES